MQNLDHFKQCVEKHGSTHFEAEFPEEIWSTTYKDHNDTTVDHTFYRVAKAVASIEKDTDLWTNNFFGLFSNFKTCPGGRILSNAGAQWKGTTYFNCFTGIKADYDQDSIDGILTTLHAQAKTLKSEGGWGMNFSFIRPRGSFIHGIGSDSPGAVKFMELFDKSSEIITEGSGGKKKNKHGKDKIRKGAQMGTLDVWHPDIEEFITAKLTPGRLTKFNISANCVNAFMDKVIRVLEMQEQGVAEELIENEDKWELIFPVTDHPSYKEEWDGDVNYWMSKGYPVEVYRVVSATALFDKIMRSTYERNDPGIQFMDRGNETHLYNYGGNKYKIKASNPCSEQFMPFGSACDLASFNLTRYVNFDYKSPKEAFYLDQIEHDARLLTRLLDNINDVSSTPLPQYEESVRKRRRIGMGIMGWGSALYMLRTRFASDKAEEIKDALMRTLVYTVVEESINLAEEKGMFEGCDPVKLAEHRFWDQVELPKHLRDRMRVSGMRNSALFSIQPTGNTGILCGLVSGGLEPVFLHSYIRTVIVPRCPEELAPHAPKYWHGEFHETDVFKKTKEGSDDILVGEFNGIKYKIDKNRGLTKEELCTDYGVKYMTEAGLWDADADWAVTTEQLSVDEHIRDMKGWCKWIDSSVSKTVNVPNDYPYESFKKVYLDAYKSGVIKGITTYRAGTMTSVLKSVDDKEESGQTITYTQAPKRKKEMDCDIITTNVGDKKWIVLVGLYDDKPYEIFGGLYENIEIPKKYKTGKIVREKKSLYNLHVGEGDDLLVIKDIVTTFKDPNFAWATRMLSTSLRHGVPVNFIVEQLQRDPDSGLHSFSKVIARVLKRYVAEGTKSSENCPDCNSKLSFAEGCTVCTNCGFSKCG